MTVKKHVRGIFAYLDATPRTHVYACVNRISKSFERYMQKELLFSFLKQQSRIRFKQKGAFFMKCAKGR